MRQLSEIVSGQDPLCLESTATVRAACQQMSEKRTGSALVTDADGDLIGIFTGRDAVRRVLAAGKSAARTTLSSVMTANPVTIEADKTALDALRLMWDCGFRHVPVIENDIVIGVVSSGDFKGDEQGRLEEERELWEHLR